MAYVRVRGRQLALVRSVRDPKSKEIAQEVLFVLYSRAEARAALGRGTPGGAEHFRSLLRDTYPDHKLNWPAIRRGIETNLEILPEAAPPEVDAPRDRAQAVIQPFLRELIALDPSMGASANRSLLESLAAELRFAHDLLGKRLAALREPAPARPAILDAHTPLWRFGTRSEGPGPDVMEAAMDIYERGDLDAAEERFRILSDLFPNHPESPNYLGCIALDRGNLAQARSCFERTVEVARKYFPARIARSMWWSLLKTRPYIRGLHNLASTLIREGQYPEAFAVAERLRSECFQYERTLSLHARIHMNTGRWAEAAGEASGLVQVWPSEAFPAGFAFAELGDVLKSTSYLLYGIFHHPKAARMLADARSWQPRTWEEARDAEVAEELQDNLHAYLAKRGRPGIATLRSLLRNPRIRSLIERVELLERRLSERNDSRRADFDEQAKMLTLEFAKGLAAEVAKGA